MNTQDVTFRESTIEDIDIAVFRWLKKKNLQTETVDGFVPVPVLWENAERSFQAKHNRDLRDDLGTLIYPIITLESVGMEKNLSNKGSVWANVLPFPDHKGGSITIARRINQDKTANFANAHSNKRFGSINWPYPNKRIVYETRTIHLPVYVEMTYKIKIITEYKTQMNDLLAPFFVNPGGVHYIVIPGEQIRYEAFMDGKVDIKNPEGEEDERIFETSINLRVLGILITEGKNEDKPKLVVRENPVEIKIPRQHYLLGDNNPNGGENRE